jgi:prepilin-type N-terminal cleavage/methylation domain-containing protein
MMGSTKHTLTSRHGGEGRPDSRRRKDAGFSLVELMVVVNIIGLVASMMVPAMMNHLHKARLAACMEEMHGLQSALFVMATPGMVFPDSNSYWDTVFPGNRPGPYFYLVDAEDWNKGHGNDLDGYDEQNPGGKERKTPDIIFVLMCQHDHAHLAKYVYIEDTMPPQIATEENDPGYARFIKWEDGKKPPGGGGKGKGGGKK